MTRHPWTRRTALAAAALPLGLGLALPAASASAAAPAAAPAPAPVAPDEPVGRTTVTFRAPGCEDCTLQVVSARWEGDDTPSYWMSRQRTVTDGSVAFRVPTPRTRGLSVMLTARWEGTTGYLTNVVLKYQGRAIGDLVTVPEAQAAEKGSACWAGTERKRVVMRLVTKKVSVPGTTGPTAGTLAFVRHGKPAMVPMRRTYDGVLGSQDVNVCGPR